MIVIRAATLDDYPAFVALFPELGIDDPVPSRAQWEAAVPGTLIAEDGAGVRGYVTYSTLGEQAHVRNLVVARDARNAGIGAQLMRACASMLRAGGVSRWTLNVKADNAVAIHLYERLGLQIEHRSTVLRLAWAHAGVLACEPATALPVGPEEDAEIERALALPSGRLAMDRGRGRVLVQLRDATLAPVGFAALDPELPAAMPFRVTSPAFAGPLLAALRLRADDRDLQVVVENDADLAKLLITVGAEVRLQLFHLSGPLVT